MPDDVNHADKVSEDDDIAPWHVRDMPVRGRKLAVSCAKKQSLTVPEWLDRAVHNQAKLDEGNRVDFPPRPVVAQVHPPQAPELMGRASPTAADLALLMQGVVAVTQAQGVPLSRRRAGAYLSLVDEQVRLARGLPAPSVKPRKSNLEIGQTTPQISQEPQGSGPAATGSP